MSYICNTCNRKYVYKYNYDRHVRCCEFLNMSIKEKEHEADMEETIPSLPNLFRLVQELSYKIDKIEKENVVLRQRLQQRRKINILEWLNNRPKEIQPKILFNDLINTYILSNVYKHLEAVYSNNLIIGVINLWKDVFNSEVVIPLKVFDNRPNMFYIYESDETGKTEWIKISTDQIDTQLKHIYKQFIVEFKTHWYNKHVDKINVDEDYTNKYVNYYQKILGGYKNTTEETCKKIRYQIYLLINQSVTKAIDLEL